MIRDRRGTAAIEFALAAPLLISMLYGLTELTRYVRSRALFYAATNQMSALVAAQQGVTSGTTGDLKDFCTGVLDTLGSYPSGSLAVSVASVTNYTTGIVRDWEYDASCPTAGTNIGSAAAVTLGTPMVPSVGDSVIVVQSSFAYVPYVTGILPSNTFKQTKYTRARYPAGSTTPGVACTVAGTSGTACPALP